MSSFGSDSPFLLLAKIKVKEDRISEYLELADITDKAVEDIEPGMLHHTFDQDPEDPLSFVWSEAYKNDDAFLAHLANPAIGEYLKKHPILADDFTVEVYGTVGEKCLEVMVSTGVPFKVFQTILGFSRL
tara:strand:- start:99 stop:488 length:390 start_codon:yes stop_codon:yes gene_type:complete